MRMSLLCGLLFSLVFACSSPRPCDGGACMDAGTPPEEVDAGSVLTAAEKFDAYCASLSPLLCAYYEKCGLVASKERCVALAAEFPICSQEQVQALAAGKLSFDEGRAAACKSLLENNQSACGAAAMTTICEGNALVGARALGEACASSKECANGALCTAEKLQACPGSCAAAVADGATPSSVSECLPGRYLYEGNCTAPVAQGASCAPIAPSQKLQECAGGSYCETTSKTCRSLGVFGAACNSEAPCDYFYNCGASGACESPKDVGDECQSGGCKADLRCDIKGELQTGICRVPVALGASCVDKPCLSGNRCHPLTKICVANSTPLNLPVGTECIPGDCVAQAFCNPNTDKCQARGTNGAACSNDAHCAENYYCTTNGACKLYAFAGDDCSTTRCAANHYCRENSSSDKKCAVREPEGEVCVGSAQCQPGLHCRPYEARCRPPAKKGELCDYDADCSEGLHCRVLWGFATCSEPVDADMECPGGNSQCKSGLFCDAQLICRAQKALGQPCESADQCLSDHCGYPSQRCAQAICGLEPT